ncbi:MAG: NosD domain-containing protein, partial [Candidatus Marinimicrobia bacterium]|nr:NosD domain-containing protein [Candidatus Neomarinimicrobiota bacterium]
MYRLFLSLFFFSLLFSQNNDKTAYPITIDTTLEITPKVITLAGGGTFLTDHSGNGNHGTISDATWSSDVPDNLSSTNDLSGTYSIGEGADYATFYAAASALSSYGISGPVTFNVLNGTYDGDFSLNSISGTSEANTVTFQSFSGSAGDVILTDSYYYANYVVKLNGADHVNFKNMTFDRSTTGSGYTRLIEIRSGTDYITFDNCVFKGYDHNSNNTNYSLIYTYSSDQYDGIVVKNCTFTDGGGYAIDLRKGTTGGTGLEIIDNTFTDTYGGIYAKYFDGITIRGNTIKGPGLDDTGIRLEYCDSANVVEDNSIYGPDMTYGLYLTYCQAASGSETAIVNNLISVEDYGIYMHQYNTYQNVYYNSVKVRDSNALYYHSNNDQFDSKNNIFYSASSASPALYVNDSSGFTGNYNDLFSNYTYPVYFIGNQTFTEYQATGNGANSVNLEPVYNTDSTLVPMRLALDNLGTPITGITDDINGSTRSETTPDMGAIEFTPSGSALSGTYTVGSGGDYTTFQSARDALVANAISGPVVINVLAGTYDEPLLLNEIIGASSTNTVTFQSADANADSVIWENTSNSSTSNYVLKLNGTDHITLKNITFKNQGSSYSQKIVLTGVTDSVAIENNTFLGYQGGNSS